jgi:hypothetical protein
MGFKKRANGFTRRPHETSLIAFVGRREHGASTPRAPRTKPLRPDAVVDPEPSPQRLWPTHRGCAGSRRLLKCLPPFLLDGLVLGTLLNEASTAVFIACRPRRRARSATLCVIVVIQSGLLCRESFLISLRIRAPQERP